MNQALGIFFHAFPLWMMTDSEQQNVREDNLDPTYFAIFEFDQWTVRDHDRNESGPERWWGNYAREERSQEKL